MKTLFKKTSTVLYSYFTLLIAALVIQFSFSQAHISIYVNQYHNYFFDRLFKYGTHLGGGPVALLLSFVVMIWNRKAGLALLVTSVISASITQSLKHFVFDEVMRPSVVLQDIGLHFVPGVEILLYNSFPSGHSTSAFALGTMLCLLIQNNIQRFMILVTMLLVCFSRIYLIQHFYQDTVAGSFIGFTTSYVVYLLMYKNEKQVSSVIH